MAMGVVVFEVGGRLHRGTRPPPPGSHQRVGACAAPTPQRRRVARSIHRDTVGRAGSWGEGVLESSDGGIGMGVDATVLEERGCAFVAGEAFYRPESAQARDLAILAVMAHQQRSGSRMRVLDCCSGSGVRGARYLQQAGVQSVWCNDYNTENRALMVANLLGDPHRALRHAPAGMEEVGEEASFPGLRGAVLQGAVDACEQRGGAPQRWRVSHFEARRLLTACWLAEDYYDFVDVDCFGAQGALTGAALGAVRHGGLLYLTCTDGLGASGRAPLQSLVQYGCFTQPTAFANEQVPPSPPIPRCACSPGQVGQGSTG
mmetsp:Transcript_16873/g.43231  ORF Transcript_16873/g.43231 Transcript_16873/m.43231 type:complete len:317 (-) Transcript_16873:596-1546(-)